MQQQCTTCPRPVPDTAFGCPACAADLAQRMDELAALLPELGITVAKQDVIGSKGVRSPGGEVPLPYNDDAGDRGRALQGELVTWARHVHAETGRVIPGNTGSVVARYLGQAASWARYRQEWPEFHAALRPLLGAALRLVDQPAQRAYLGPCQTKDPETGKTCWADVLAKPGAVTGKCRECGAVHDVATSRKWLLDSLVDVLLRPAEIASVLRGFGDAKVGYSTIAAYVADGLVVAHGEDGYGRPRYRVGDVLEVRARLADRTRRGQLQRQAC